MKVNNKIEDKKLQYYFNKEAEKVSALSSGNIDKYEYLTSEEVLPFHQSRIMEKSKFTYFPLGKALGKQTKRIEYQGEKQIRAIKYRLKNNFWTDQKSIASFFSKDFFTEEGIYKLNKIVEIEQKVNRDNLIYKAGDKKKK